MNTLCIFIVSMKTVFGMLFHEPSFIEIKSPGGVEEKSFGFSLGYQKSGKLVIGAPFGDLDGRVYTCAINDIMQNHSKCIKADIDVESLTEFTIRDDPQQNFAIGASIAATNDYFLTCAPFWKSSHNTSEPEKFLRINAQTFGTCFVYNGTAYRFNGMYEQYLENDDLSFLTFGNGLGWSTLVDETNKLLIIPNIFDTGHMTYISTLDPLKPAMSTGFEIENDFNTYFNDSRNIGRGIASGIFLVSGVNKTMYVSNSNRNDMTGKLTFMSYENSIDLIINENVNITSEDVNTMYGWAILCADLNSDGHSELLVGAPAYGIDDDIYESGALYIYTGGDLDTIGEPRRTRIIYGNKAASRFASVIASTDVDGDNIPEIIVSAPSEDSGLGAVYVICGVELLGMLLKGNEFKAITLSQLGSTQRIQRRELYSFGYSLQVIPDVDDNGSDELAVGSPDSSRVFVYRGIPSVKMDIVLQVVGEQVVRIKASKFTIRMKVDLTYPKNRKNVTGNLIFANSIIGNGVNIKKDQEIKVIDLSTFGRQFEIDINVDADKFDPETYRFSTSVNLDTSDILNNEVYNPLWVTLYPETVKAHLDIERRCSGDSCLPQLNMTVEWSGSTPYKVGSTTSETVTMRFMNEGSNAYVQTCVLLRISGARLGRYSSEEQDGGYMLLVPSPILTHAEELMAIPIDMSNTTNNDQNLIVDIKFYNSTCTLKSVFQPFSLVVPLEHDTSVITISGTSQNRNVTDSDVLDTAVKTIEDVHEYTIQNNGAVAWKDVVAIVKWKSLTIIRKYKITTSTGKNCERKDLNDEVIFTCIVNLEPHTEFKLRPSTEILEADVEKNVVNNTLTISSSLELILLPTEVKILSSSLTRIEYHRELSLRQNKSLIMIIATVVAVIILLIVFCILYKIGFFKRKTKQKLKKEKREDEIRKSMKRPSNVAPAGESSSEGVTGFQNVGLEAVGDPVRPEDADDDSTDIEIL